MFAGIDIGSSSTNIVLINQKEEIEAFDIFLTSPNHKESAKKALNSICTKRGCLQSEIKYIVSTGYGRKNVEDVSKNITEIHVMPEVRGITFHMFVQ